MLRERDGFGAPIPVEIYHPSPMRGKLIERLSVASLQAIAEMMGWTLAEIEQRYA